jgi:hypothetical protein
MWQEYRIACITYHKHPTGEWPTHSFVSHEVPMPNGEIITMKLAERGSLVGSGKNPVWMVEVRKLTKSGHQTSLISTAYQLPHIQLAARMFSRWCQENFFRYMMQHFAIDLLNEYGTVDFPDIEMVVNPKWRELNRLRNATQGKLKNREAAFGRLSLEPHTDKESKAYALWSKKKAELLEEIQHFQHHVTDIKNLLRETQKHIPWGELEHKDTFQQLLPQRKRLMDTVRMVAYRAETALALTLKEQGLTLYEARKLLQDLFVTEADILPDQIQKIIRVCVHNTSRPVANKLIEKLMKHLNDAELIYPGTEMMIKYELRGG